MLTVFSSSALICDSCRVCCNSPSILGSFVELLLHFLIPHSVLGATTTPTPTAACPSSCPQNQHEHQDHALHDQQHDHEWKAHRHHVIDPPVEVVSPDGCSQECDHKPPRTPSHPDLRLNLGRRQMLRHQVRHVLTCANRLQR